MEVSTLNLHFPDGWSGIIENGVFNWWIGVGKFHSTFQVTERGEDSSPDSLVNHFKSLDYIHWKKKKVEQFNISQIMESDIPLS